MDNKTYSVEDVLGIGKQQLKDMYEKSRHVSSLKETYDWRTLLNRHTTSYSLLELELFVRLVERMKLTHGENSRWHEHWVERGEEVRAAFDEFVTEENGG